MPSPSARRAAASWVLVGLLTTFGLVGCKKDAPRPRATVDAGALEALLAALDGGLDAGPAEPEGDELARGPGGAEEARVLLKGTSLLAERLDGTRAPVLLAPSGADDPDGGAWDLAFADADGDGHADIVVGRPGEKTTRYDVFLFGARSGHAPPFLIPDLPSAHWLWAVPEGKSPDEVLRTMPKERFEVAEVRPRVVKAGAGGKARGARELVGPSGRVYVFEGAYALASRLAVAKADVPAVACLPSASCALEVTCDAGRPLCRASVRENGTPKPCAERVFWPVRVSGAVRIAAVAANAQGC